MTGVNKDRLKAHVQLLARSPRHSLHQPQAHQDAIDYIGDSMSQASLEVSRQVFPGSGRTGVNVVGVKPGSEPELAPLLLAAHYDTVPGSPGADDNASGVAVLLELARLMGSLPARRSVELVAFDMEEEQPDGSFLVGSRAFVRSLHPKKQYAGVYVLEMVGYTSGPNTQNSPAGFGILFPRQYAWSLGRDFRGDFLAVLARGQGVALAQGLADAAQRQEPELPVMSVVLPRFMPPLLDFMRSDHAPFWFSGIPAVMITDTADFRNPNYHRPSDTLDTLDLDFMAAAAEVVASVVAAGVEVNNAP